jgi:uncharacterized protein (TIGR02246 family)
MRSPWILAAFAAAGLAMSASAQQASQSTRQQMERLTAKVMENYGKQDAAGMAGLFTRDAIRVAPGTVATGNQQIAQFYQNLFKSGVNHLDLKVEQVAPLGRDAAIVVGEYRATGQGQSGPLNLEGRFTSVAVRQAGVWKNREVTTVPNPPPASGGAAASPAPTR